MCDFNPKVGGGEGGEMVDWGRWWGGELGG